MKNIKKVLMPLFCIICLVMSFALVSCGECNHVWGEWTAVGDPVCGGQPEERVCSECGEKETRNEGGAHTYGEWTAVTPATCTEKGTEQRVCSTCQNKETREVAAKGHTDTGVFCERCLGSVYAAPAADSAAWETVGMKVTDFEVEIVNAEEPEESAKMTLEFAELYATLDEAGMPQGYGKVKIKLKNTQVDNAFEANAYIEDGFVYVAAEGTEPDPTTTDKMYQYIKIELEKLPELEKVFETIEYLQQQENQETIDKFAAEFPKWLNEKFIPLFKDVKLPEGPDAERIAEVAKFANGFFKVEKAGEGVAISFNYDNIKAINATLSEATVAQFIEMLAGEGFCAELEKFLTSDDLYNFSAADLVNYIQVEQKVDLVKLLDAADALMVILTEDETMTVEKMIAAAMGTQDEIPDLATFLQNEELLKTSVKDLVYSKFGSVDDPETKDVDETVTADQAVANLKTMITSTFDMLEATKLYAAVAPKQPAPMPKDGEAPEQVDPVQAIKTAIDEAVDQAKEIANFVVTFDKDKKFVNTVVTAKMPMGSIRGELMIADLTVTITAEKVTYTMKYDGDAQSIDVTMELLPNFKFTPDAAKLAQIKAETAKAPAITPDIIKGFLDSRDTYMSYWDVYVDEANKLFYVIRYNYTEKDYEYAAAAPAGQTAWRAYFSVSIIEYDKVAGINVAKACTDLLAASYQVYSQEGSLKIIFYADAAVEEGSAALATVPKADIINMIRKTASEEALEANSYQIAFLYDVNAKEIVEYSRYGHVYQYGHEYELVEDKCTEAVGCLGIGKDHYECKNCDAEYDEFYTNGHEYDWIYTKNADGSFTATQKCSECEDVSDYTYSIGVVAPGCTVEAGEEIICITITPEETARYRYYAYTDDNSYANLDDELYIVDGDGENYVSTDYAYIEDLNTMFSGSVELTAGETYKFYFGFSYDDYYDCADFNVVFELMPVVPMQ